MKWVGSTDFSLWPFLKSQTEVRATEAERPNLFAVIDGYIGLLSATQFFRSI